MSQCSKAIRSHLLLGTKIRLLDITNISKRYRCQMRNFAATRYLRRVIVHRHERGMAAQTHHGKGKEIEKRVQHERKRLYPRFSFCQDQPSRCNIWNTAHIHHVQRCCSCRHGGSGDDGCKCRCRAKQKSRNQQSKLTHVHLVMSEVMLKRIYQ